MPEWWSRVKNSVRRRKPALSDVSRMTNQAHNLVAHAQRVHNVAKHANKGPNNVSLMVYQGNVRGAAQNLAKAQQVKEGAVRQLNALKRGSWTKGPLKRLSNGTVRWANAATYSELRGAIDSRARKTLKMNDANVRMAKQLARAEFLQKNLMDQLRQAAYKPASSGQGNVSGIRANYDSIRALTNASKKQLNGVRKSGSWVGGPFVLNTKTGQPHVNWNPKNQALFNSVSGRVVRNAGNKAYLLTHTMVPRSRQQTLQRIMNKRSPMTRGNLAYLRSNPVNKIAQTTRNTTARASTSWLNVYRPPMKYTANYTNNHIEPNEYSLAALGKAYPRSWTNLRRPSNGSSSNNNNNRRMIRRGGNTPKSVLMRGSK
jgi:hypothetical protein